MRRKRRGSAGPIYTFAIVWLLLAMSTDVSGLAGFLVTAGVSLLSAVGLGYLLGRRNRKKAEAEEARAAQEAEKAGEAASKKEEEKSPYSPEVQQIIKDGRIAMKEMGRLYSSIQDPEVRSKINELMSVSDKIVRDAIDDPSDVPQIRKFLDYYLPTTIKLLNAYDRMGSQGVSGENITTSMERIEDMLDTAIAAYKKQLDALFANQAADIQMDIETMNGMLAREGLGGKSYLDLREFMKQYEKQQQYAKDNDIEEQKGSTANG